ncbi:hypothetical protein GUJ93_ZPchr0012g19437 [Zizania palustris]|uniref:Uncharacterized protein n=1 Tax=Zizania palustris TaxID=103762 RepID=A0A8J5WNA5_ZIZPA|nr:hypothetical protein GUJ93_ZPchr0012g19437 [Zizania palustris]
MGCCMKINVRICVSYGLRPHSMLRMCLQSLVVILMETPETRTPPSPPSPPRPLPQRVLQIPLPPVLASDCASLESAVASSSKSADEVSIAFFPDCNLSSRGSCPDSLGAGRRRSIPGGRRRSSAEWSTARRRDFRSLPASTIGGGSGTILWIG